MESAILTAAEISLIGHKRDPPARLAKNGPLLLVVVPILASDCSAHSMETIK
jgi:hypothetical protein